VFRFVHCADLHLDSPLRGIAAKEGAPLERIRGATRRALENLVRLCIEEQAGFMVIAGDVYDGDWEDYSTGLFFVRCMARLRDHGIRVYLIRGNHDAASQITRRLPLPDNVVELPVTSPATVVLEDLRVAIHGQGFAERAVTQDLSLEYPAPVPGYFNIGMLHTCAEGREGHETYAPCRVENLVHKGYDYWALGHIHKREVLCERPWIVFPGNLQGRHIRETGEKGCTLVTVDGTSVQVEHRSVDVLRWLNCEVDLSGKMTAEQGLLAVQGALTSLLDQHVGYPLAVRIELVGETVLHTEWTGQMEQYLQELRAIAAGLSGGDAIWLEKVLVHTRPVQVALEQSLAGDALGALRRSVTDALEDTDFLEAFVGDMKAAQLQMRAYLQSAGALRLETNDDAAALIPDAETLLMTALRKAGHKP